VRAGRVGVVHCAAAGAICGAAQARFARSLVGPREARSRALGRQRIDDCCRSRARCAADSAQYCPSLGTIALVGHGTPFRGGGGCSAAPCPHCHCHCVTAVPLPLKLLGCAPGRAGPASPSHYWRLRMPVWLALLQASCLSHDQIVWGTVRWGCHQWHAQLCATFSLAL